MGADATVELSTKGVKWRAVWRHTASSGGRRGEVGSASLGCLGAARGALGGEGR